LTFEPQDWSSKLQVCTSELKNSTSKLLNLTSELKSLASKLENLTFELKLSSSNYKRVICLSYFLLSATNVTPEQNSVTADTSAK